MGSVNFEVTGGRGERFLNDCVNAGVPVEHIRPTQTGYLATVPLRDYKRMHKYARRNRCRLRVREKYGAYFALFTYRHRWGILAGLVLCVLRCALMPQPYLEHLLLQFYAGAGSIRPRAAV